MYSEDYDFLNKPITVLNGIGPKKAKLLSKLNINNIWDLIYYFPYTYEDRRQILSVKKCEIGKACCIKIKIYKNVIEKRIKTKLSLFLLYGIDEENTPVCIKWFSAPYSKPKLQKGIDYNVYGVMKQDGSKTHFELRQIEESENARFSGVIVPVYKLTSGISSKQLSDIILKALDKLNSLNDCIDEKYLKKYSFYPALESIKIMHNPDDYHKLKIARDRFAFEELLILSLALSLIKVKNDSVNSYSVNLTNYIREYASKLPFELTDSQKNAINDITKDIKSSKAMNRLIQGDVGSGKTAIAASIMYSMGKNGYQSVFMAPTEILAKQHYNTLKEMFGSDVNIELYTSSTKGKDKILEKIKSGICDVVIGTHALIEDKVKFNKLALCITDEQHRFGVNQRAILSSKSVSPHILVMSATPIPRTLSLILYGDLDISTIKTMPKGRVKTSTYHIKSSKRKDAYTFIEKEILSKRQCYIVCPLVENSESIDALSVEDVYEMISKSNLSKYKIGVVHGKLKNSEKDEVMSKFKNGEIDILISTTVIEVGVDVPNSTIMLIENAERFGLSQLHQLRGRVGRGSNQSYCILVSDSSNETTLERLKIMTSTCDGFEIAQKDLELRGCGQFFGTKQHGIPELKVANLFSDSEILEMASSCAKEILINDTNLTSDENHLIKDRIDYIFSRFANLNIFN